MRNSGDVDDGDDGGGFCESQMVSCYDVLWVVGPRLISRLGACV